MRNYIETIIEFYWVYKGNLGFKKKEKEKYISFVNFKQDGHIRMKEVHIYDDVETCFKCFYIMIDYHIFQKLK